MNTKNIDILIVGSALTPELIRRVDENFTTHKLWLAPDREAFLRAVGPKIRGVLTKGSSGMGASRELIEALPNLEIITSFGVGYDAIAIDTARSRGVMVTNTPTVLNECVADTAMGMILAVSRRLCRADAYVRAGRWPKEGPYPLTDRVSGKAIGIAGLGGVGSTVARRAEGFGMDIHYYSLPSQDAPYTRHDTIEDLAHNVDYLVLTLPGGDATRNLVNASVLEALGPNGYLVNIARGSVVDEAALLDALRNGTIAGAALDVFVDEPNVPQELFAMENVVLLPHVGSATKETRAAMASLVYDNLAAYFAGKPPLTRVA